MFSSLSKPFVVAWYDTSEAYLLVFGLLLLVALYAEFLAEPRDKKFATSRKQKRIFEEGERPRCPSESDSFFKKYKRFFGVMVVISVFGELLADGGIFAFGKRLQIISDRENTVMALQVAGLNKESQELRQKNDELEAKQLRSISPQMRDKFISILNKFPTSVKCPVRVFIDADDVETRTYANQIREMLDEAEYTDTNGVIKAGLFIIPFAIDDPTRNLQVAFIFYGKPRQDIDWNGLKVEVNNPSGKIIWRYDTNSVVGAPGMISMAFKEIGIVPAVNEQEFHFLKPGEWGIYVPQKF